MGSFEFNKIQQTIFNSHSSKIQCAVIPRKNIEFDDVYASIVNDILLFTSNKN